MQCRWRIAFMQLSKRCLYQIWLMSRQLCKRSLPNIYIASPPWTSLYILQHRFFEGETRDCRALRWPCGGVFQGFSRTPMLPHQTSLKSLPQKEQNSVSCPGGHTWTFSGAQMDVQSIIFQTDSLIIPFPSHPLLTPHCHSMHAGAVHFWVVCPNICKMFAIYNITNWLSL